MQRVKSERGLGILLWATILVSAAVVLSLPANMEFKYGSEQSVGAIQNLGLFALPFYVCIGALFVVLVSDKGSSDRKMVLALIVFATVFLGYWQIQSAFGIRQDEYEFAGITQSITSTGHIMSSRQFPFGYLDFPGLFLVASSLSQLTGLQILNGVTRMHNFLDITLLSLSSYLLFRAQGARPAIASTMMFLGAIIYSALNYFSSKDFGVIIFMLLAMVIFRGQGRPYDRRHGVTLLLLFIGLTIIHALTALFFLGGVLGLLLIKRNLGIRTVSTGLVTVMFLSFLTWLVFWSSTTFQLTSSGLTRLFALENSGTGSLSVVLSNLGVTTVFWESAIRVFWIVLIYVAGLGLFLAGILRIGRQDNLSRVRIGLSMGVIAIYPIIYLANSSLFLELLTFLPLFFIPLIMKRLLKTNFGTRSSRLVVLAIVLSLLSFPTFLTYNDRIVTYAIHPQEQAVGRTLSSYARESTITTDSLSSAIISYYLPSSGYQTEGIGVNTRPQLASAVAGMFSTIKSSTPSPIFVLSPRFSDEYQHRLGVSPDNPLWKGLDSNLSQAADLIYVNGFESAYVGD